MRSKVVGILLILLGICLVLFAAGLVGYNLWDSNRADLSAQEALAVLNSSISENTQEEPAEESFEGNRILPEETSLQEEIPPHVLNPDLEMLEKEINGIAYIGILEIPDLALELPIAGNWNLTTARKAPCRYVGSVYKNNMVVAGHNYQKHFGRLASLPVGSQIRFEDMEGNVFCYETIELETVQAEDIDGMCEGDWDLTLFTCTIGGHARTALRCRKLENIP